MTAVRVPDLGEYWGTDAGLRAAKDLLGVLALSGYPGVGVVAEPVHVDAERLRDCGARLARCFAAIRSVAAAVFEDKDELYRFCSDEERFHVALRRLSTLPKAHSHPMRWDVVPCSGGFKAVEVNYGWSLGGINFAALNRCYDEHLGGRLSPAYTDPMAALLSALRRVEAEEGKQRWVLCDEDHYFSTYRSFIDNLTAILSAAGFSIRALPLSAWREIDHASERVIEVFTGLELTDDDSLDKYIATASSSGKRPFTSPYEVFWSSKAMFALAWRGIEERVVDEPTARLLSEMLPRTYVLRRELRARAIEERADWVLKPAFGLGGKDVTIGPLVENAAWLAALDAALQSERRFVLQRYEAPLTFPLHILRPGSPPEGGEHPIVLGLFQLDGAYSGAMARAGRCRNGNINVHTGAGIGIVRETVQ